MFMENSSTTALPLSWPWRGPGGCTPGCVQDRDEDPMGEGGRLRIGSFYPAYTGIYGIWRVKILMKIYTHNF
ncbi:hypothetical protein J2129_001973 [Methanofollis sp. W23]|nr:hypothetical protein [Methanofollis sp. W23]